MKVFCLSEILKITTNKIKTQNDFSLVFFLAFCKLDETLLHYHPLWLLGFRFHGFPPGRNLWVQLLVHLLALQALVCPGLCHFLLFPHFKFSKCHLGPSDLVLEPDLRDLPGNLQNEERQMHHQVCEYKNGHNRQDAFGCVLIQITKAGPDFHPLNRIALKNKNRNKLLNKTIF